jgi:hypothetical protein
LEPGVRMEIADVIKRHDDHHQPAQGVDGLYSWFRL